MSLQNRRIQTEAERLGDQSGYRDNGMADLVVFYTDRLLGRVPFGEELFSLALATIDDGGRQRFAEAILAGRPKEELEALLGEDGFPDVLRLRHVIAEALEHREHRRGSGAANPVPPIPAALIEAETVKVFRACHDGRTLADPCETQRERLDSIFGLDVAEIEILVLLWCAVNEPLFRFTIDALSLSDFHAGLAACAGVGQDRIKRLLSPRSRLLDMGFVKPDFMPPPHYALGDEIRQFFNDPETLFSFVLPLETYRAQAATHTAPLDSFPVPAISRGILEAMLRGGRANVLVHGAPGTGKTTFVTSLLENQGLPAFIMSAVGGNEDERPPLLRLKVAAHLALNAGATLVVDESDSLINTSRRGNEGAAAIKAWLTEFMDCHASSIIWIANDIDDVHDAVKRRFVYSLEFKPQTERQRVSLWKELVRDYGFDGTVGLDAIASLSKTYAVNAGGIDIALRGLRSVVSGDNPRGIDNGDSADIQGPSATGSVRTADPVAVLSEILRRHETLMSGGQSPAKTVSAAENGRYLPEAINVDTPLAELVAGLSDVARGLKDRMEAEAANGAWLSETAVDSREELLEAKLLFSGGPGTGKTAFARWLATALGLPLVQKRASDLLSPFVGGTEQLIAAAFEEAEELGALLLLDEADSLFIDRSRAGRSWERSQTNELLTRMEAFSGILVCCTNRREDFDTAAMRRFQWKLTFSPPRASQRLELYRRYFSDLCGEPDTETVAALAQLDGLCPGDFAAVHNALRPIAGIRRKGSSSISGAGRVSPRTEARIAHAEVLDRLRAELDFRRPASSGRVGFGN